MKERKFAGEALKFIDVFAPTSNRWSEIIFIVTGDSDRKWQTALANFAESARFLGPVRQILFPKCFESPPLIFDTGQKTILVAGSNSGSMMPAWMATACHNVHAYHFAADFLLRDVCDTQNGHGR